MEIKLIIEVNTEVIEERAYTHPYKAFAEAKKMLRRYRGFLEGKDYQVYVIAPSAVSSRGRQAVVLNGRYYPSITHAVQDTGMCEETVKRKNQINDL